MLSLRRRKLSPKEHGDLPFVGMDDIEPDGLVIRSSRPFSEMKSAGNGFEIGDILYGRLRPYLNKVALTESRGAASGELLPLVARKDCEPRFLQLFLHSRRFVNCATEAVSGDRPRIDYRTLANFAVPIAPISEQKRIVARIEELFAEIDEGETALKRARRDLDTFRRALLKAAVTGELTRDWREKNNLSETGADLVRNLRQRYPRVGPTQRSWTAVGQGLSELPNSWAWSAVAEAGEVQLGRQRAPKHHQGFHLRPYLRVANVLEDKLDLSDVKFMNFTPEEYETFALREGDVLLNEGQAPDLLGRPAMYRGEIDGFCFQKTLLRFRAKKGILPDYALIVFRHYMRSGRFKRESRITTNIGHLTQIRFIEMEFPIPPTAEQHEIARRFHAAEQDATEVFERLPAIPALSRSILKAAFEGRLLPGSSQSESERSRVRN